MTTRTTRTSAHRDSEKFSGQEQIASQLAEVAEVTSVLYSATESLQQINQQLTERAALRQHQLAKKLREAQSPTELLSLQSTVFTEGMQEAAHYWQEVAAAAMKMQSDMMEHATTQKQSIAPAQAAASNPVLQAWQTMFTAPLGMLNGSTSTTHH